MDQEARDRHWVDVFSACLAAVIMAEGLQWVVHGIGWLIGYAIGSAAAPFVAELLRQGAR